jgi:septal ring factor EnvC (AmiA/AmiB activator)
MPEDELAELRRRLSLLKEECQAIGQVPPRPATLRASLSGIFVTIMQRLMFWYAPPVQRAVGGLIQLVEEELVSLETRMHQETQRAIALETRLHQVHTIVDEQIQALRRQNAELEARLQEQTRALEQERSTTIDLENNLHEQIDVFQQFQEDMMERLQGGENGAD